MNWRFGLFLILIVCIPRFLLVLNANKTANYGFIGLVMVISALAPFIFLNKNGLKTIGLTRPRKYHWLFMAFISGLAYSILLYFLGEVAYSDTISNWYVYIGKSYNISAGITASDKLTLFAIMAITGMIFSPIGEELFFRGIVHGSLAHSFGDSKAAIMEGMAFALTHIAHFGLIFIHDEWNFLLFPTILWVISMFMVSIVFYLFKKKSGSIWGAILGHAAFNLGMIYCIFFWLN